MLLSMTGYGKSSSNGDESQMIFELRSVNSKFLDIRLKLPVQYKEKELEIRRILSESIVRGKVEANLTLTGFQGSEEYDLDLGLIRRYCKDLEKLAVEIGLPHGDILGAVMKLPNILVPHEGTIEEEEWNRLQSLIGETLAKFNNFRKQEGEGTGYRHRSKGSKYPGTSNQDSRGGIEKK